MRHPACIVTRFQRKHQRALRSGRYRTAHLDAGHELAPRAGRRKLAESELYRKNLRSGRREAHRVPMAFPLALAAVEPVAILTTFTCAVSELASPTGGKL